MKKFLFLALLTVVSCTKYEDYPLRPVSFEIGDRFYYSAKDTESDAGILGDDPNPQTMGIRRYGDSLDIEYTRWKDFLNHDILWLNLYLKGALLNLKRVSEYIS